MPSINMIAPRRAEKKRLEYNVRRLLVVIVVEVAIIVGVAVLLASRVYSTRSMISGLEMQLVKLQPTVNKIKEYETATKELAPKLDTLNDAKAETLRWCQMMGQVSDSLPKETWLTRIATARPKQDMDIMVSLTGVSANQKLVGLAMLNMHDKVTDFNRIDLEYTQKTVVGPLAAVEFQLAAAMKPLKKTGTEEVGKS